MFEHYELSNHPEAKCRHIYKRNAGRALDVYGQLAGRWNTIHHFFVLQRVTQEGRT